MYDKHIKTFTQKEIGEDQAYVLFSGNPSQSLKSQKQHITHKFTDNITAQKIQPTNIYNKQFVEGRTPPNPTHSATHYMNRPDGNLACLRN